MELSLRSAASAPTSRPEGDIDPDGDRVNFWRRLLERYDEAGQARRAEARGDWARALELWMAAGQPDQAARVELVRADAESDPQRRLELLSHAIGLADPNGEVALLARSRRAHIVLATSDDGAQGAGAAAAMTARARQELLLVARESEATGDFTVAAKAYARAGDVDGRARALIANGEVNELEDVLASQLAEERASRTKAAARADAELLVQSGRRREAVATLRALSRTASTSGAGTISVSEQLADLLARRISGPRVAVRADGRERIAVLGHEVTLGRTEGGIVVNAPQISRNHLRIARDGTQVIVVDLASRNGTLLGGHRIAGPLAVAEGMALMVGGEIELRIEPAALFRDGIEVQIGGVTYALPLGPAALRIGDWGLASEDDGWVALSAHAPRAFCGTLEMVTGITLLAGDAFAARRGDKPALCIAAADPSHSG